MIGQERFLAFIFRQLPQVGTDRGAGWHGARNVPQRADAQTFNLNSTTL
jgi:hypothetical protein